MDRQYLVTSKSVRATWDKMCGAYGVRWVRKHRSTLMRFYAWALDLLGVCPADLFWRRFVTTTLKTIYVPFTPGDAGLASTLIEQLAVLGHEFDHFAQRRRDGWVRFGLRYLFSRKWRCWYELSAYRVTQELTYWLTGQRILPIELARKLDAYGFDESYIRRAKQLFKTWDRALATNQVLYGAAGEVARILERVGQP